MVTANKFLFVRRVPVNNFFLYDEKIILQKKPEKKGNYQTLQRGAGDTLEEDQTISSFFLWRLPLSARKSSRGKAHLREWKYTFWTWLKYTWINLKHTSIFLEKPLKLPWSILETSLKHSWNFLETLFKLSWNTIQTLWVWRKTSTTKVV